MTRKLMVLLAATLLVAPLWGCGSNRDSSGSATTATTPEGIARATAFVGADRCGGCHSGKHDGWVETAHTKKLRDGSLQVNFINDGDSSDQADYFDGTAFDLATQTSSSGAFGKFGAKAPVLGKDFTGPYAQIDGVKYYITYTLGGSPRKGNAGAADANGDGQILNGEAQWKQRYITTIGKSNYILPIQFNGQTAGYVTYDESKWYADDGNGGYTVTPPVKNDSYERRCAGCHVTGLQVALEGDEWTMSFSDISVSCEACHGPGGRHVTAPSKDNILNPATMTTSEDLNGDGNVDQIDNLFVRNYVCYQCHSRGAGKHTAGGTTLAYPSRTDGNGEPLLYIPGLDWKVYYDVTTSSSKYWGGAPGTAGFVASKSHHQQQQDFDASPHAADKSYDHECFVCHDMHDGSKGHMITSEIVEDGIAVVTDNDDDSLCLACHAGHGPFAQVTPAMVNQYTTALANNTALPVDLVGAVTGHTLHSFSPTSGSKSSRCSKCHLPKTAKSALPYDIHTHKFTIIQPQSTLDTASSAVDTDPNDGVPNACVSCHAQSTIADVKTYQTALQNKYLGAILAAPVVTTTPTLDGTEGATEYDPAVAVTMKLGEGMSGVAPLTDCETCHSQASATESITLKAVHDATDLYLLASWPDADASLTRGGWTTADGGATWATVAGQSEDRLGVFWPIGAITGSDYNGNCMTKCHTTDTTGVDGLEDEVFLETGSADMWQAKAARGMALNASTLLSPLTIDPVSHEVTAGSIAMAGVVDDKNTGQWDAANAPDGGRFGDTGSSAYGRNRNASKNAPLQIESVPTDFMDAMVLTQAEIDAGETIVADPTDAGFVLANVTAAYANYTALGAVVPERILRVPTLSRGDVLSAATWTDGTWTVEIKRALDTGNADDVIFVPGSTYDFGMATMDNGGGGVHKPTRKITLDVQ